MPKKTIRVEIESDEASVERLKNDLLSLRPILSELSDEIIEQFFIGIRDLKPGPTAGTINSIRFILVFNNKASGLVAALPGEPDPVSFITTLNHN